MMNLLAVVIGFIVLVWLLLVRRPRIGKTLAAWRWMVLAWGLLILVHLFSPIEYLSYQLSTSTVLYCALWVGLFVVGDELGYRFSRNRGFPGIDASAVWVTAYNRRMTQILTVLSLVGLVLLGMTTGIISVITSGSGLAQLRVGQIEGTNEGIVKTVATLLASVGLVAFLVDLSASILSNNRFHWFSTAGFIAYLCIYIFSAGRSGWILGGGCLLIVIVASRQLLKKRYKYFRRLAAILIVAGILGSSYFIAVVTTRTHGWTGDMDNKIKVFSSMGHSVLDDDFRESLRPIGAAGDTVIEIFYYLSPQLYGLEHGQLYYRGDLGSGMIQFPYITRRFEQLFDVYLLDRINDADRWSFEQFGLAPNFFRTAVHSTFIDFGLILSLPFVLGCGFWAGRNRATAIHLRAPLAIALQALICSGAAWTIIFSPFIETGWAFPLMWFLVLKIIMRHPQPVDHGSRSHVAGDMVTARIDS